MNVAFNSQNFTGTYVKPVNVLKKNVPTRLSLIELTKQDVNAIDDVAELWDTKITEMLASTLYVPLKGTINQKIYAVSSQTQNFEKVCPKKILGIFEVTDRGDVYALEYLETKPTEAFGKAKRTFSKIGEACMDFIKTKFKKKDVEIYALEDAAPFYEKMGCVKMPRTDANFYIIPKHD